MQLSWGRSATECIDAWLQEVEADEKLTKVPLTRQQRIGHLPQVFRDLIARLNANQPLGTRAPLSAAAAEHGMNRRREGYSASMLGRIKNTAGMHFPYASEELGQYHFSVLLYQVMTIADEVDSQLRQAMDCYVSESAIDALPV